MAALKKQRIQQAGGNDDEDQDYAAHIFTDDPCIGFMLRLCEGGGGRCDDGGSVSCG